MPMTRRKRANPPDQPENNHHQPAEQNDGAVEQPLSSEPAPASSATEPVVHPEQQLSEAVPPAPDNAGNAETPATNLPEQEEATPPPPAPPSSLAHSNGDRVGSDYAPSIEGGRRTSRGELFRRPPQMPPQQSHTSFVSSAPLQAPTHEIALPLGNLLHLAYNPGYTGSDEARSLLLHRLADESKSGGRARCWNCGSLAIVYDCWNTRSRTFGEVGVAFCEICGVWSVL